MMAFRDRSDAGRRLAKALSNYKGRNPVILALPRGGVPVAAEVAAALKAPLDLILVRKVGGRFSQNLRWERSWTAPRRLSFVMKR
jgi:putative phosphoribosyl transferase